MERNYHEEFFWLCFFRGNAENLGNRFSTEIEELENLASLKKFGRMNTKEVLITKEMKISYFMQQTVQQNYQEETTNSKNTSGQSHGDREEFQPEEPKDEERIKKDSSGSRRSSERISFIVIILNREVELYVPREESYPFPLSKIDVTRSTYADLEIAQEKRIYDDLEVPQDLRH